MGRFLILFTLLVAVACTPLNRVNPLSAGVAKTIQFSEITVKSEGASFESDYARQQITRLAGDVDAELEKVFASRKSPNGWIMEVRMVRLNVADSRRTAFGYDQTRMTGVVTLINPATSAVEAVYDIDVRIGDAAETKTGALIQTAVNSQQGFYRAAIVDFANITKTRIME